MGVLGHGRPGSARATRAARLLHPFTAIVAGMTGSGKTVWVQNLLQHASRVIQPPPQRIVWSYSQWQPAYEKMQQTLPGIEFVKDIPHDLDEDWYFDPQTNNLIVIDDQMAETSNDKRIMNLFTKGSHHRNLSVIFLCQNVYFQGKIMRTLSLNAAYLVLDQFLHKYEAAVERPFGYLFVDLKPNTPEECRLRTNVLPNDPPQTGGQLDAMKTIAYGEVRRLKLMKCFENTTASIHQELGEDKNDPIMVTSSSSSDDSSDNSSVSDDTEDTSEMEVSSFEVCQQSSIRQIHDDSEEFDEDERNLCSIAVRSIHGDMTSDDICENITVQTSDISSAEDNSSADDEYEPKDESEETEESDEEDELVEDLNLEKGACSNASTERILEQFKTWLQAIISAIDPNNRNIKSVFFKKNLRDKWLANLEKTKKPGTCKSYLASLSRFLRFIMVEKPEGLEECKEDANKIREQVQEWMCSMKGPVATRKWEKLMEDLEKLIKPEDIQKFDKCDHARSAVSTLGKCMEKDAPKTATQADYVHVRDYIITRLCLENACRAGPIANMTLGELRKAKKDNDQMVVTVMHHKTLVSHGPATVVLSPMVLKWLQAFITYMRNHLAGAGTSDSCKIFLSWSAKEMSSSMVSAQLNSCWQKAMGKQMERVCAASFRKAAVTAVHENHAHMKNDLADLMSHNPKTAEKYYAIRQKNKNAAKTSEALRHILFMTKSNEEEEKSGANKGEEKEPQNTAKRHRWSEDENVAVCSIFTKDIKNKCITVQQVKDKIHGHALLGNIAAAKIVDKVRNTLNELTELYQQDQWGDYEEEAKLTTEYSKLERAGNIIKQATDGCHHEVSSQVSRKSRRSSTSRASTSSSSARRNALADIAAARKQAEYDKLIAEKDNARKVQQAQYELQMAKLAADKVEAIASARLLAIEECLDE
ncbi:hypothetical protein QZH41_000592 [Actinostola sp. cb2023]|nr:hypothetical protein QZH41_000592 [Actinostola sp. cb2023]